VVSSVAAHHRAYLRFDYHGGTNFDSIVPLRAATWAECMKLDNRAANGVPEAPTNKRRSDYSGLIEVQADIAASVW
jgi:hypothetical protein